MDFYFEMFPFNNARVLPAGFAPLPATSPPIYERERGKNNVSVDPESASVFKPERN